MFLLFFAVITDSKNRQDHSKETFVSNRRLGFQPKFVITKSSFKTELLQKVHSKNLTLLPRTEG